jgi:hypothetical protein
MKICPFRTQNDVRPFIKTPATDEVSFVNAVTPKMPKPLLYGLVTGLGHLIGIIIAGVIIYEMN